MEINRQPNSARGEHDWRDRAACSKVDDPELFFPVGETGPAKVQIEKAKKVCGSCTVRAACLDWALYNDQDIGIWGGLSERERRSLKKRYRRAR
jgi:WhiB family redox-sensing transcriptional regulator